MNTLSKWGTRLSLVASLILPISAFAATKIDSIAAIIDDDLVLQSDVSTRLVKVQQQLAKSNTNVSDIEALTSQVLDQLIIENLQLQIAAQKGIYISETALNSAIARIAKNNQLSMDQLEQAVNDGGETMAQFKEKIRQEMTINEVQKTSVNRRIDVSEYEIDRYLASTQGQKLAEKEYEIGHILVGLSEQPNAQELTEAQQKLDQINSALAQGTLFASVAATYSDASNALKGGSLGWRKGSQLPALFASPIKQMDIGEVSEPIRNSSGFHIITLINKRGVSIQSVSQTRANHILILPNEIRSSTQAQALINELHQRLANGADFYDLARTFSDDANSAPSGGDLGWLNDNQLPQVLQKALDQLDISQLSPPIKSTNGWHLLQAVERRTKDIGQANLRFQAKQAIIDSKFANELENWLRDIRNQAYIEIR